MSHNQMLIIKNDLQVIELIKQKVVHKDVESVYDLISKLKYTAIVPSTISQERTISKLRKTHFDIMVWLNQQPIPKIRHVKQIIAQNKEKLNWRACNFTNSLMKAGLQQITNQTLPIVMGTNKETNQIEIGDLITMPHLLVAGQTGSGKSVWLNVLVTSLTGTRSPEECQIVLVDPKRVEFAFYKNHPSLWRPVASNPTAIEQVFKDLIDEMETRLCDLEEHSVRNLTSYNQISGIKKKPFIVVIVDELADLIMVSSGGVEEEITRLAQLARAAGIHLVLATQRPVTAIITGLIKANMPTRIAFKVAARMDSRIILDAQGAERLAGKGEYIWSNGDNKKKMQSLFISDAEIKDFMKNFKSDV